MRSFEIFEHTADTGLRLKADSFEELLRAGAEGLYSLMTDPVQVNDQIGRTQLNFEDDNASALFLKWLRELLFIFSSRREVMKNFQFTQVTDQCVIASAGVFRFDARRHEQRCEVKAVTYHGYKFENKGGFWTAEVIVDL